MIERAYEWGERWGLAVWCEDEAGPYQTVPYAGSSWQPEGEPRRYPHEYFQEGTAKLLTLFHPASGIVRVQGVTSSPNAVLHPWLKRELSAIVAQLPPRVELASLAENRQQWESWRVGLSVKATLSAELPPLRMLLVMDNLAGHKTPDFVVWLFRSGYPSPLHAAGRQLVEHGRVHPTDSQTPSLRRTVSGGCRYDYRLVGSYRSRLERSPDPFYLGRQTPGTPSARP